MCGIAGYTGPLVPGKLEAMLGALVPRGPDDEGSFHDERVHMGMRRLSIVDLATGRQPKASHDGRVVVVFNGEIYNHVEVRAELESRGCRFESEHSDTETIVHAWLEYGVDMPEQFVGMFAIALYDLRTSELYLFRDRLGKKPISYCEDQGSFSWASEPNALLLSERAAHIDRASVAWYFSHKTSPGDRTADDPEELVLRPKEGFVEPAVFWLRSELRDFWRDRILGDSFNRLGLLQPDYARDVATWFDESGDFFLGKKVWSLLVYALWEENVLAT